jgi:hypothetical protein
MKRTERVSQTDHDRSARGGESELPGAVFHAADGARRLRYSAEILLAPGDWIILDDDSVPTLEARAMQLMPATLYSRMLARTA